MESPVANNQLNSLGTFNQRTLYTETAYQTGTNAIPIDLWYEKQLYGKLNHNRDPVFLSEAFLKQLNSKETLFTLNFVTDAFNDLKDFFTQAAQRNKINITTSAIQSLEPKFAWNNVNDYYNKYISMLFEVFNETFVKDADRDERLQDFDSFLRIFIEYIDTITPNYPFTRTSFITSKYCSPLSSGLMIELNEEQHDQDQNKFEKYIQDPNFTFYTKAARQFGFVVDKNAPWRLISDLASPALKPYLDQNKISLDTLFDQLYYESFLLDIEVLKVYVLQFYNSYVNLNPSLNIPKINVLNGTNSPITEIFKRKAFSTEEMNNRYDFNFWLRMLVYLRAREVNESLNQFQFEKIVKVSQDTNKFIDTDTSLRYINRRFRGVPPVVSDLDLSQLESDLTSISLITNRIKDFSMF